VTTRIVAALVLVAALVAAAAPLQATPIDVDDPIVEVATVPERVELVVPARTLIAPVSPSPAALRPRLHVENPFRPPRA
jgi:hypothetical protein